MKWPDFASDTGSRVHQRLDASDREAVVTDTSLLRGNLGWAEGGLCAGRYREFARLSLRVGARKTWPRCGSGDYVAIRAQRFFARSETHLAIPRSVSKRACL